VSGFRDQETERTFASTIRERLRTGSGGEVWRSNGKVCVA
jgi:hypothetical protein